jgi:hypothetical protein
MVLRFSLCCFLFAAVFSIEAASVSIAPNPKTTPLQQNFTVNFYLDTATQVRGCTAWITRDPAKLTFVSAARGSLFNGFSNFWWQVVQESSTTTRIECLIMGAGLSVTGPGNLLNLTYTAIAGDFTTLTVSGAELFDISGYAIPNVTSTSGDIIIGNLPAYLKTKCWLQGPYSNGTMSTGINSIIPLTSPFTADPVTVSTIPADAVDWMLMELRSTYNGQPVKYQSVFLGSNGYLRTPGKPYVIFMNTTPGSYFVVIRHRNHLPVMSSNAFQFASTGSPPLLDLTSVNNIYGGLGVVVVAPGIIALPAGDADLNGTIAPSDRNLFWRIQTGTSGYLSADFNLNGNVAPSDLNGYWRLNTGLSTSVPLSQ